MTSLLSCVQTSANTHITWITYPRNGHQKEDDNLCIFAYSLSISKQTGENHEAHL